MTGLRHDGEIERHLEKIGVTPDYAGPLCLDLEGPGLWDALVKDRDALQAARNLRAGFARVRRLRPHARTGIYHLPYVPYSTAGAVQVPAGAALGMTDVKWILRESGALFPSVYDAHDRFPERDWRRHQGEVLAALQIASRSGAEVIAYMTHRYVGGRENSGTLIPRMEFQDHLRKIVKQPVVRRPFWRWLEGFSERVAGVCLWGADRWYLEHDAGRGAIIHEERGEVEAGAWIEQTAHLYLRWAFEAMA